MTMRTHLHHLIKLLWIARISGGCAFLIVLVAFQVFILSPDQVFAIYVLYKTNNIHLD